MERVATDIEAAMEWCELAIDIAQHIPGWMDTLQNLRRHLASIRGEYLSYESVSDREESPEL